MNRQLGVWVRYCECVQDCVSECGIVWEHVGVCKILWKRYTEWVQGRERGRNGERVRENK